MTTVHATTGMSSFPTRSFPRISLNVPRISFVQPLRRLLMDLPARTGEGEEELPRILSQVPLGQRR